MGRVKGVTITIGSLAHCRSASRELSEDGRTTTIGQVCVGPYRLPRLRAGESQPVWRRSDRRPARLDPWSLAGCTTHNATRACAKHSILFAHGDDVGELEALVDPQSTHLPWSRRHTSCRVRWPDDGEPFTPAGRRNRDFHSIEKTSGSRCFNGNRTLGRAAHWSSRWCPSSRVIRSGEPSRASVRYGPEPPGKRAT